ncbi:hat family dimerization domain containing protein expressed [Citrus sinensis]|uniref:Hat family dimerization domain containing protein expressed n=1 Tax=Citrus sinensis TaxID=2711 RepID=A0ACB8LF25_CITSI|nr:hat family dimerization domain containing protein expressed [Citrus sinensis]
MSDNVEINSSSAPDLSRNVEDKTDNKVEEISVSTVNDKKSKEETRKKKKVSEAWEHFTKIMNQPNIEETLQGSLKVIKIEDGTCGISYSSFDQNVLRSLIARMVIMHELPLRFVEYKSSPSNEEWDLAVIMVEHLKSFYMLTEMFSGTKYPIANLFFPLICKMKLSINRWRTADNLAIRIMADKMADKFDKYWNEIHPMLVVAVVLDPRYKMMLIHFYFPKIYGDTADELIECAHKLCYDSVKEYKSKAAHVTKSELDRYLDEELLDSIPDFDILAFWKMHTSQYPILAELAKDILAIPVSTVASESAFSAGGRFLSPHRSKLLPDTLEALMCAQNWIWASTFRGGVSEDEIFTGEEVISDDDDEPQVSTSSMT